MSIPNYEKNGGASKCHWQDVSQRWQTEPTLERRGSRAGSLGTLGVSSADRGKAFLGSNQDFCPNSLCTGILRPSYKSNPEPEDWPGVPEF